ncbi:MAG: class I SAM-dependent methyltransferase [Bacteroidota bacterium]
MNEIQNLNTLAVNPSPTAKESKCRFCATPLTHTFVNLGMSPICNDMVKAENLQSMEPFYPLHTYVCESCFLVQLDEFVSPENIFDDYTYFSSYSSSWLEHCKKYVGKMISERGINSDGFVVELASNDGYLLQYFKEQGIPHLGIEPAKNVAEHAIAQGIQTEIRFFGIETAVHVSESYGQADLILGNNVLAHVPDINDFVGGMKVLLKPSGFITMEFPHLLNLIRFNQFDTIYHEHFSYLSWIAVERIFAHHGLTLFDVEELPTHGGSLRIYARHAENHSLPVTSRAMEMKEREIEAGLNTLDTYTSYTEKVKETKRKILEFLITAKREGKKIVGYGAPGKGNTLLNYCSIRQDFLDYTVDKNPHKQGKFLPGTHIPVFSPEKIAETQPDYVMILPWNLKEEIMEQMAHIRDWGGKFVVPIPEINIY